MKGTLIMTTKGQKRSKVMEMLILKQITQIKAAELLSICERQVRRVLCKYKNGGDEKLNHGLIGKPGNHRLDRGYKQSIMDIVRREYRGFKPTFIAEKLYEEHHIQMVPNTLRLWMLEEGLWEKVRKGAVHRSKRPRKEHFGEMLQIDGSIHDWFDTGKDYCLMNVVDDATGISYGLLDYGETTFIAMTVLFDWINKYGIPSSIYSDYKSLFYTGRESTIEEQLAGIPALTEFGRVCYSLGIEIMFASSAQAKGRVERWNGVHQDRLIAEMKLKKIQDIETANRFLKEYYWEKNNRKFGKKPLKTEDFHIALTKEQDLRNYVCYYRECKVYKDFTVRLNNRLLQITSKQTIEVKPGDKVMVKTWLDGSLHMSKKNVELNCYEINEYGYRISA